MIDQSEIRRTVAELHADNGLFEVRLIDGKWNASGYFTDAETLLCELERMGNRKSLNAYITLNNINEDCYCRAQRDKFVEYATPTTGDTDIIGIDRLMVDIDPKRAAGTSSSDEQLYAAKAKANEIFRFLRDRGWNNPVIAQSGNGVHLLYGVRLIRTQENVKLMQNCLAALGMIFTDDTVDIDLKTYNPARICKLYGTMARKGADTQERPHRMSYIVYSGSSEPNSKALLEALAGLLPQEEKPEKYNGWNPRSFDLEAWISKHGLRVTKQAWQDGSKWVFEECPFDDSHKGKDAAIIQTRDGKICFNCFHNSCADNKWRELRLLYEPDAYDKQYMPQQARPNYRNPDYQPPKISRPETLEGKPDFYTIEQVRALPYAAEEYIKTGTEVIDRKMRGLAKGSVSCISGLNGSGKSSWVSQLAIEAAEQGYRTAIFSGELTARNVYRWLVLQAAGHHSIHATQFENYYRVSAGAEDKVAKWLNGKVYIYNNDYGNRYNELHERLNDCVRNHKVDLVILDNLMALNITMLEYDKNSQQSIFVKMLTDFAKAANIHIAFVAHPRKPLGFLRKDDISGSSDISNMVNNVFIVHRVNEDFKRLSNQMFRWPADTELYKCDNVIEICKDRATGVQDVFIPLYFCKPSKRLRNSEHEYKAYGWGTDEKTDNFYDLEEVKPAW